MEERGKIRRGKGGNGRRSKRERRKVEREEKVVRWKGENIDRGIGI